jgi:CRP/FNR family cyclic AMP-dependent transcriptional regulator
MRIQCKPCTVRNLPFFAALSEEELAEFLKVVQHRTYPARATILRAGDTADALYFILSGRVHVLLTNGQGREVIVAVRGPSDFFGETGLLQGAPRVEDVRAYESCDVLCVPRTQMLEWLQRNPNAAMFMLRTLSGRLANAHRTVANLALLDVYSRVARVLVDYTREVGGQWLVEPGSELIASMVGASREMVSRVVKDMLNDGMVRRHKRKLVVLDRAALMARAAPAVDQVNEEGAGLLAPPMPSAQPCT